MAGTPAAVARLLEQVWTPAKKRAAEERDALAAMAASRGDSATIEPWDWRYYAEKVRQVRYSVDDASVKPYFALERVVEAAFDCADRLFGLRFVPRPGIAAYHPDVKVYEVRGRDDRVVGVFLHDNFARPTKRGGAWMSSYRLQSRIAGDVLPIIVNNNNFAKGAPGEPTLLSLDDALTLFHEFGHGLHGLLSQVTFESLSGTQVLRDFVELPSQIFENWLLEPDVLRRHARHVETGEPMPDALIERLEQARRFNQGFETVEYTACALVDMALHACTATDVDITAFEREELKRLGMPREIVMRHRLPHFLHLFASSGYAAGYYVYMWAEVLDADGYNAFLEAGNPFDPAVAERLRQYVYSAGNTLEPGEAFRAFRGRDPKVEPMLLEARTGGSAGDGVTAARSPATMTMASAAELGFRSELIFHRADGEVIDCRAEHGCRVIRTPSNPTFYWGNYLLFDRAPRPGDARRWPALFERLIVAEQPLCRHRAFGWLEDAPGDLGGFLADGYTPNNAVVMQTTGVPTAPAPRLDARLRPLAWTAPRPSANGRLLVDLSVATRSPEFDKEGYRVFARRSVERWRALVHAGRGHWFGAFIERSVALAAAGGRTGRVCGSRTGGWRAPGALPVRHDRC